MIRWAIFIALVLFSSLATGLYMASYEMKRQQDILADLNRDIARERASIKALEVEWARLNQPDRLQSLIQRFSNLTPIAPENSIARLASLPMRPRWPQPAPVMTLDALPGMASEQGTTLSGPVAQVKATPKPKSPARNRSRMGHKTR